MNLWDDCFETQLTCHDNQSSAVQHVSQRTCRSLYTRSGATNTNRLGDRLKNNLTSAWFHPQFAGHIQNLGRRDAQNSNVRITGQRVQGTNRKAPCCGTRSMWHARTRVEEHQDTSLSNCPPKARPRERFVEGHHDRLRRRHEEASALMSGKARS